MYFAFIILKKRDIVKEGTKVLPKYVTGKFRISMI